MTGRQLQRAIPACLFAAAAVFAETPGELTFDAIFATETQTTPRQLQWGPDGRRLSFVWQDTSGRALWLLDVESGRRERLLAVGAAASGDPRIDELDAHHWSPDGRSLLLEAGGDLHLLELGGGLERLTATEARERTPRFSPDGRSVAFVRDWDLWVTDLDERSERRLTHDGRENEILNGITDWVYWEEIWDRTATGFWWSPDSTHIAYYRFDEREVRTYPMVDFTSVYPEIEWQKYPKAGETNPVVRVGVIAAAGGETVWLDGGDDPDVYLARVDWLPDASAVAIQRLNREQDTLDLLGCDARNGECRRLLREVSPTWVNLTHDLTFLDGGDFLWTSEASGWRRLARHDADGGVVRVLSPTGWNVTQVDGVLDDRVLYTAHSTEPLGALHRTVFAQPITGGEARALTPPETWSAARVAPVGDRYVRTSSAADSPTAAVVSSLDGGAELELPSATPPGIDPAGFPAARFLTIPGPDGSRLPAMLMTPPGLDRAQRHPAIMYHYGGPNSQVVADRWSWRDRSLWHVMMAQRGYVVLMVDNRASNYFGKHGHDRAHRRFGPENLAAQRAGVEFLGTLGYVDVDRIGLWGGSGGGYHTLYALTNSPGTWRAGVAFAPVSDFRLYDTIWTERYLDHPQDNPDGYRESATTTYAGQLADHLLMVHGTADDNVHPQNTLLMAQKLIAAGKPFEMAIHPRQKHGFRGRDARHFYERMTAFFDRHLRSAVDDGG